MNSISESPRTAGFLDRFLPGEGRESPITPATYRIGDIFAVLQRQRKIMIPLVLLGPIAGALVAALTPPVYEGNVSLKIDNDRAKIIEGQDLDPVVAVSDTSRYLATQAKLVASRSLASDVIDAGNLARDNSFLTRMGAKPKGDDLPPGQRQAARREQTIALLQSNVTMNAPQDNRIATISFRSRDPVLAAQVANAYADKYVNQNILQHIQTNVYARKVLADQVAETRRQLETAEQQAIAYSRVNRLIDTGNAASNGGDGKDSNVSHSVTTANLVAINASFVAAQAERIAAEQRWRVAERANAADLPEARENGALQSLIQQRSTTAAKLAQLRKRYIPEQPEVQETSAELATVDAQIASVGRSIRESIRNEYVTAVRREGELAGARDELAAQTLGEQEKRVELNLISRNADTLRQQLADLYTRLNQVTSAADINTNNISIVDRAQVPDKPILPSPAKNILFGLLAGIALAVVAASVRELLDDTLHTPEDVENKLRLPFLGATPLVNTEVAAELMNSKSGIADAYYSIRTAVDYASGGPIHKVLMVTSGSPKEGKSTSSMALAQDFARTGRRVLLIDADMRRPTLHRAVGVKSDRPGFTDVLMHQLPLAQAVVPVEGSTLMALPLGKRVPNPVHLLSSKVLDSFIASLRDSFDVVILDSAPVMGLADAPLLARVADGIIFVVEAGRAHNGLAKVAIRRLGDNGAQMLGIIMSKFSARQGRYGYSPYYYYGYDYRYGDDEHEGTQIAA